MGSRPSEHDRQAVLWVASAPDAPHPYVVECCRRAGATVRELFWACPTDGERPLGRLVEYNSGGRQELPRTVKAVSPRLLLKLARAPEDVVVLYELGLPGLYAGLAKLLKPRRRRVVSLVEADYRHLGRSGGATVKVAFRRLCARFVDVFVANNPPARDYLLRTLRVPEARIVVGWWLAGLPPGLEAGSPEPLDSSGGPASAPSAGPLFVCACRLVPQKGVDLLIEAAAYYRREFGRCRLWLFGDGPEREALERLARRLGVDDAVSFRGTVDHRRLKGALEACDAFVFPTLRDFVGRVVVEALTAGAPVVLSPLSGAAGTIVQDGVNGIIADPRDCAALAAALYRAADPATALHLREGVQRTSATLTPEAAASVVLGAVAQARDRTRTRNRLRSRRWTA